ncbi:MAG: Ig-like domain repeat protein [Clostridiaceae bacterium]|nr:Ig-like domain repeat protein [Clostridiaceae bacterium]
MKHLKRTISFTLLSVLLLTGIQPVFAAGDLYGPKLSSVTVMDQTRDGNDLKYLIQVEATDNKSGVEHITVQFKNLSKDRMVSKVLRAEDGIDGVYSGWLKINAYEPDGKFTLYRVTLTDYAGNYQIYCRSQDIDSDSEADEDKLELPNSAVIKLDNGIKTLDEDAPVLVSISASPQTALTETEIKLTAKVTDKDGSGVDYVKARFVNQNGHGITINLDPENGSYIGTVSEIQTKYAGTYVLDRVMVKDNAGNRAVCLPGSGALEQGLQFVIIEL